MEPLLLNRRFQPPLFGDPVFDLFLLLFEQGLVVLDAVGDVDGVDDVGRDAED